MDDSYVAFQVSGSGSRDVLFIPEFATHVEMMWDAPRFARVLERLQAFGRLIMFDQRGTGLSDSVAIADAVIVENWVEDAVAVLDAVGSRRCAVIGVGGGAATALMLAATQPQRVTALVALNGWARLTRADDYPFGYPIEVLDNLPEEFARSWGHGDRLRVVAPDLAPDAKAVEWFGRYERNSASPGVAAAVSKVVRAVDFRSLLGSVHVPTLVMHRAHNVAIPPVHGEYLARHIHGATFRILPGDSHAAYGGRADEWLDEAAEFLTGRPSTGRSDRVLASLLFTDIVDSTGLASRLGDRRWKGLLERHDILVRRAIDRFGGSERESSGDGCLAAFAGPAHAIRCALAIIDSLGEIGLSVRIGVHTGEVELHGDRITGVAVYIARGVMEAAQASEVLVSRTVIDLLAGSNFEFERHAGSDIAAKGGSWPLYAVAQRRQ